MPRAEITSCEPGSANVRSTSVRGMMNVPRGRFMVIPDGVMSSAWQSWTLRTEGLLDGEHRRNAFGDAFAPLGRGGDPSSWFHLKALPEERKKTASCPTGYLRGWASSMMKFGMSSTTR